ncbi:hypothetical protein JTB14_032635 [Gonioctena quinquepunctata]|nr:hypothetical protein JTB14_032635 [Gonioctena quinquepunctata]
MGDDSGGGESPPKKFNTGWLEEGLDKNDNNSRDSTDMEVLLINSGNIVTILTQNSNEKESRSKVDTQKQKNIEKQEIRFYNETSMGPFVIVVDANENSGDNVGNILWYPDGRIPHPEPGVVMNFNRNHNVAGGSEEKGTRQVGGNINNNKEYVNRIETEARTSNEVDEINIISTFYDNFTKLSDEVKPKIVELLNKYGYLNVFNDLDRYDGEY